MWPFSPLRMACRSASLSSIVTRSASICCWTTIAWSRFVAIAACSAPTVLDRGEKAVAQLAVLLADSA